MNKPTQVFVNTADGVDLYELIDDKYQKVARFDLPTDPNADAHTSFGIDLPFVELSFVEGEIESDTEETDE